MTLVLTYHRIVASPSALKGFFDVTADELKRHLEQVTALWGRNGTPGDLLAAASGRDPVRRGFLITFDDGTVDHYTVAAPILEQAGARGIFFVTTSRLDQDGYLSVRQCRELQERGHAIESHSHEHKPLTQFAEAEMRQQLGESRRRLRELGLGRWDFVAVPGGYFSPTVAKAAQAEHYTLLRTLRWGYNRVVSPLAVESITINRRTAGRWFWPLVSPRFEGLKRAVYHSKELVKTGRLSALYYGVRDRGKK